MTRRPILSMLLLMAAALSACAWMVKVNSIRYDRVMRQPRPDDHPIPLLADTSEVDRPYVLIGMVQADMGHMGSLGEREMLGRMRKEARLMGGDALVNLRKPLSLYSKVRGPEDRDLVDREWPQDRQPSYRLVADVISYDIRASLRTQPRVPSPEGRSSEAAP